MSYSCSDFFDVVTDQLYRNGLINGGPPDEDVDIEAVTTEVADAIQGLLEQRLSDRELSTVLAALRYWQREGRMSAGHEFDIAENGGEFSALTNDEIDELCERLNG